MGNVLGGTDAVQKLASLPIFELRVFAEQKRRHGFSPADLLVSTVDVCVSKLEVLFAKQKPAKDGCVHKQQRDLCIAQISSFNSVQGCTLLNIWHGRLVINVHPCTLMTFEFFKNYIFEKRTSISDQYLTNRQKNDILVTVYVPRGGEK